MKGNEGGGKDKAEASLKKEEQVMQETHNNE